MNWTVNYTGTQSFVTTLPYSLTKFLWQISLLTVWSSRAINLLLTGIRNNLLYNKSGFRKLLQKQPQNFLPKYQQNSRKEPRRNKKFVKKKILEWICDIFCECLKWQTLKISYGFLSLDLCFFITSSKK